MSKIVKDHMHMGITLTTPNKATLKDDLTEEDMDITHTLAIMNHLINSEILNSLILDTIFI